MYVLCVCLTLCFCASTATTVLYQYQLNDDVANYNYAEGSVEYHCFDEDSAEKTYVRGTYGYFGYFEGKVDPVNSHLFYVSFYESTAGTLVPVSGAAALTYNSDFTAVIGPYWATGSSKMHKTDSWGVWNASLGSIIANDSTQTGRDVLLEKCLFSGITLAKERESIAALTGTTSISGSSGQGVNTLCKMPAGPAYGSWLGTYTYIFPEDEGGETEKGNYGTNPFAFQAVSGMGFVGNFHSSTGPDTGLTGSVLYMISGTIDGETTIRGFFCYVDENLVHTECYAESYRVNDVNANADNCPANYRLDGSLDSLYSFASAGSSKSEDNTATSIAVSMAILFGTLTFVLLVVIFVIYLTCIENRHFTPSYIHELHES